LIGLPVGCPFYARCAFRVERCLSERPQLEEAGSPGHTVACWRWKEIDAEALRKAAGGAQ